MFPDSVVSNASYHTTVTHRHRLHRRSATMPASSDERQHVADAVVCAADNHSGADVPAELPADFVDFCRRSNISLAEFALLGKLPRYLRFTRAAPADAERRRALMADGFPEAEPVDCFRDAAVWRMPQGCGVRRSPLFEAGDVAGIDLGSIMAVAALDVGAGDSVLDVCCAPGAKLSLAAEQTTGRVTGVDCDPYRLSAARACLQKYKKDGAGHVRLVLCDATGYDPAGTSGPWWPGAGSTRSLLAVDPSKHRKRLAQTYPRLPADVPPAGVVIMDYADETTGRRRQKRRSGSAGQEEAEPGVVVETFDRVMVDAECTTDGSLRHVQKVAEKGGDWGALSEWAAKGAAPGDAGGRELFALQVALLRRGAALARCGGVVVYSTCSLSQRQNDDVVAEVLRDGVLELAPLFEALVGGGAALLRRDGGEDAGAGAGAGASVTPPYTPSVSHPGCAALFTPRVSACGTLFVAKFRKKETGGGSSGVEAAAAAAAAATAAVAEALPTPPAKKLRTALEDN